MAILIAVPAAAAADATRSRIPAGSSSTSCAGLNVYAVSQSQVTSCGDTIAPLISTGPDANTSGITDYTYDTPGTIDSATVPPASFDALTATAQMLQALGLPARPAASNTAAYDQWSGTYGKLTAASWVTPTNYEVVATAAPSASTSPRWSGYADQGGSYVQAAASWSEPTPHTSGCKNDGIFTWGGLGGATDQQVEQGGTSYGVTGLTYDGGWTEFLPSQKSPINHGISATPGQLFGFNINFVQQHLSYSFPYSLMNFYTNKVYTGADSPSLYSLASAEGIIERPTGYNLLNFSTDAFLGSDTLSGSSKSGLYGSPNPWQIVDGSGTVMAGPTNYGLFDGDSYWVDNQYHCQ